MVSEGAKEGPGTLSPPANNKTPLQCKRRPYGKPGRPCPPISQRDGDGARRGLVKNEDLYHLSKQWSPPMVSMATQTSLPGSDGNIPWSGQVSMVMWGIWTFTSSCSIETAFPPQEEWQTRPVRKEGLNKIQRCIAYNESSQVSIRNHSSYQEHGRSQRELKKKKRHSLCVNNEITEIWE